MDVAGEEGPDSKISLRQNLSELGASYQAVECFSSAIPDINDFSPSLTPKTFLPVPVLPIVALDEQEDELASYSNADSSSGECLSKRSYKLSARIERLA